jgi:hypothetical protein
MIHVATVHWRDQRFISPQINFLKKYLDNFKVWAFMDKIDPTLYNKNDFFYSSDSEIQKGIAEGPFHAAKLQLLFQKICSHPQTKENDIIIFMDGDAWPIDNITNFIESSIQKYELTAIVREENSGDQQPHPCFCFSTVGFWKNNKLDWSYGLVNNKNFPQRQDVGGSLLRFLNENAIKWQKIKRTQGLGEHPVFYGVYGDIVYHHGAGYRVAYTMEDILKKLPRVKRDDHLDFSKYNDFF